MNVNIQQCKECSISSQTNIYTQATVNTTITMTVVLFQHNLRAVKGIIPNILPDF